MVINQGEGPSEVTQLRYYRSPDSDISSEDAEVGAGPVGILSAAANSSASITLRAPSEHGTFYYGACVEPVTGESNSNTDNNCTGGVRVAVIDFPSPEMVLIRGGTFRMGNLNGGDRVLFGGVGSRSVSVPAFRLGKYEVTFAQWDACVAGGGCGGYRPPDEGWGRGNRPVINVSRNDAQSYIDWLNSRTGGGYRLPTEAEWEYAARAGSTALYLWGSNTIGSSNRANCVDYVCGDRWEHTAPVGRFPAERLGFP